MSWSQVEIEVLIYLHQQNPCLYNVKKPTYHNKHARNAAFENIQTELKNIGLVVTIQDIKTKFNNLRANFMAQHRKYIGSLKSGMASIEIAKPSLWYYNYLLFLLDHSVPRNSVDSIGNLSEEQLSQQPSTFAVDNEETESLINFDDDTILETH